MKSQWNCRRNLAGLAVSAFGLLCGIGAWADEAGTLPAFEPPLTRAAVFKNGYVFTFREGDAKPLKGWVESRDVPMGVLGTVWAYSLTPNVNVTQVTAAQGEKESTRPVESLREMLLQNEGARVRVTTVDRTKMEGTLQVLTPHSPSTPLEDGTTAQIPRDGDDVAAVQPPRDNEDFTVVLRTEHGIDLVDLAKLASVDILDRDPKWDKVVKTRQRQLSLKLEGLADGASARVGIAALEKGIRWIPGYRVVLKENKMAQVELEATVIDDLADITDGDFYFVVGVPHFLMSDTLSPLALRTAFTGLSGFFNEGENRGRPVQALMTQQAFSNGVSFEGSSAEAPALAPASAVEDSLPTLSAQQLFLYRSPHLSMKKGDRASLRLFSATVPITEVYEWTIRDSTPAAPRGYGVQAEPSSDLTSLEDRVWYALKLKNNSEMPWTTGPATSFTDWKPMGQDLLAFTPVGGSAILKVTPATEIIGEHQQDEKSRQRQAIRIEGAEYDLVTVDGSIRLRNTKKEPAVVCVTRRTDGEIVSASDDGKISREGLELQAVNPHSVISWEVTVPPGDKEIHYTYKRYVRN